MSTVTPAGLTPMDWVTDEDLAWRPKIESQQLDWNQLKRIQQYEEKVPAQRITEHVGLAQQVSLQRDVSDELMRRCFAMMGRANKPRSVRLAQVLQRLHFPRFGLSWRQYLWFRMLYWEFDQWAHRIMDQSGLPKERKVEALLSRLPQIGGKPDRPWPHRIISGEPTSAEAAILWRWLVARGRRMGHREWTDFTSRFAGVP